MDRRWSAGLLTGVGVLLLAAGWASRAPVPVARAERPLVAARIPPVAPTRPDALAPGSVPAPLTSHDPARFADWMAGQSSLRGTELDGSWDVDGQGRLHPTIALRRRFDQLLTLAGEASIDEITAFIEHDVRELVGPAGAAAVLDAWQRYVALQRYAFHTPVRIGDRSSFAAALAERQPVRRRILGEQMAEAFFADEDAQLQTLINSDSTPVDGALTTRIDPATLSADARARLQAEDAAWADWQRRLEAARRDIAALQAAPQLSPLQRDEAIARLIAQRFDVHEAVRVRALLHLPPA